MFITPTGSIGAVFFILLLSPFQLLPPGLFHFISLLDDVEGVDLLEASDSPVFHVNLTAEFLSVVDIDIGGVISPLSFLLLTAAALFVLLGSRSYR